MTQETQVTESKRFTVLLRDEYQVDLEYNESFAILHLPSVTAFKKSTYKDMKDRLTSLDDFLRTVGYSSLWAAIPPKDELLSKLVTKLDFVFRGSSHGYDVYERKL